LIGLGICWLVIVLMYRDEFRGKLVEVELPRPHAYPPLLSRTTLVVAGMLMAFLAGLPVVSSACVGAGLLLVSRLRPAKLLAIDWELLVFFGGLFIVTGAIEVTGLSEQLFSAIAPLLHGGVASLSLAVAATSNVVSNVPAVLLLRPEMVSHADPQRAWLTLAMSSTLAGNLTLLGSAATLIVAEVASVHGVKLSFRAFLRAGVPITVLTLLVGIVWLTVIP